MKGEMQMAKHAKAVEVKNITTDEVLSIIETGKPKGKFVNKTGNLYVAIDNQTGDTWHEVLCSLLECDLWFQGLDKSEIVEMRRDSNKEKGL